MEKNTVLAIVLSTVVLIAFFVIQNSMMANNQEAIVQSDRYDQSEQPDRTEPPDQSDQFGQQAGTPAVNEPEEIQTADVQADQHAAEAESSIDSGPDKIEIVTIETNTVAAVLTNEGGNMVSWILKDHWEDPNTKKENVNMIFNGDFKTDAFSIALGGAEKQDDLFYINRPEPGSSEKWVEFYRDYYVSGNKFRLTKRYDFKPNDYMFELTVTLEDGNNVPGNAYTLNFGPQIGPKFDKLDAYNRREYFTYVNGKHRKADVNKIIDTRPAWASISGKYFIFIAIPHVAQYTAVFSQTNDQNVVPSTTSGLSITRPALSRHTTDAYKFYLGPKSPEVLNVYHTGRNDFGYKDSSLVDAAGSSGFWGPLVRLLKWLLLLCYRVVPNYGVAIILLTLLIKIVFFPLTKKSSAATSRMQELAPKIKEIQEKYKGNSQKLNAEMAAFYQKEGYNPLSGCLPMLLQIPIFIGMYQLFNTHFDLRGAGFIAGWIPDLSMPESIFDFPNGFKLPLLGWEAIRALPFIYVGSQLMYGKFTQTPGQQSGAQMKMMMYIMPIMFFFILYNVPSGLLVYWIFSNILTLVQQIIINKYNQAKKAQKQAAAAEEPRQKIVPPNKRKKR